MNNQPFTPDTYNETTNFRFFTDQGLADLAARRGLLLPVRLLARYREICRTVLLRDPSITELDFLDRVFRLFRRMPAGIRIAALTGADPQTAHVWGDICRKWRELGKKEPPSLGDLATVCGKALARAGIAAPGEPLCVGSAAGIAALCGGNAPKIALRIGSCAAAQCQAPRAPLRAAGTLYLLSATDEDRFPEEIREFCAAHARAGIVPLALTGGEGILPHLATGTGLDVDISLLPGFDPEAPGEVLFRTGRRAFLFFAPQNAFFTPQERRPGDPLPFGSSNNSRMLTLRAGNRPFCTLPAGFFPSLATAVPLSLTPRKTEQLPGAVSLSQTNDLLLAGAVAGADVPFAVAQCLAALAAGGAELSSVRMGAVLEMPPNNAGANAAEALPLLFGYHRAAAELVLPAVECTALQDERLSHPKLTVFLRAARGNGAPAPLPEDAVEAVRQGDFCRMRQVLSEKM